MIISRRHKQVELSFGRLADRLDFKNINPFSYFLLPTGLVCLLLIFVSLETNQRIRTQTTPVELEGVPAKTATLWFSVAPAEGGIFISGNNGDTFLVENGGNGLQAFEKHLQGQKQKVIADVALANRMDADSSMVILSLDESLTYAHIRPIIYVLGKVGISRYGFEGRVLEH